MRARFILSTLLTVGLGVRLVHAEPPVAPAAPEAAQAPAAPATPAEAPPVSVDPRTEALVADLAALRKDLDAQKAARVADQKSLEALEHGTVGGRFGLRLGGFLQMDVQSRQASQDQLSPSTGDPVNEDRFLLRRARLRLDADYGIVSAALELDANTVRGATARVIAAEAAVRWPGAPNEPPLVGLTFGIFKIPFGFEIGQSDRDRLFMERTVAERALFPGEYDLGARLAGGWQALRYAVALMNGDPLGERAFPGRDPNRGKDVVGRLGLDGAIGPVRVQAGFSALWGRALHAGTAATKDVLVWRDLNENGVVDPGETQVIPGSPATPSQAFDRFALGGDVRVALDVPALGELAVYGEVVAGSNLDRGLAVADPVAVSHDVRERGYYVALTQALGRWFAIGARYDHYDPDSDASDRQGGKLVPADSSYSGLALTGAVSYSLGRLSLEYERNQNHLGRDGAGNPTSLDDNAIVARAQVQF